MLYCGTVCKSKQTVFTREAVEAWNSKPRLCRLL